MHNEICRLTRYKWTSSGAINDESLWIALTLFSYIKYILYYIFSLFFYLIAVNMLSRKRLVNQLCKKVFFYDMANSRYFASRRIWIKSVCRFGSKTDRCAFIKKKKQLFITQRKRRHSHLCYRISTVYLFSLFMFF